MKSMLWKSPKKLKKAAAGLAAASLCVALLAVSVPAVELDPQVQPCTVTVETPAAFTIEEVSVENVVLDFYEIAKAVPITAGGGSYDGYEFSYLSPFAEKPELQVETITKAAEAEERDITAAEIDTLTQNIAKEILVEGADVSAIGPGRIDEAFTLPEAGLYLIVPHGEGMDKDKYVIYEKEILSTIAETEDSVLNFSPILVSVPNRGEEVIGEGVVAGNVEWIYTIGLGNTANVDSDWDYDIEVTAKAGLSDLLTGKLELTKNLVTHEYVKGRDDPATFVFDVEVTKDGKSYYSNVHAFVFQKAGSQSVVIEGLPIGGTAVIKEVYAGGNYTPDKDQTSVRIIADDPDTEVVELASAEFTNSYDDHWFGGGSVINHIVADEHGWSAPDSRKIYSDGREQDLNEKEITQ